jgi:hypothetical protein
VAASRRRWTAHHELPPPAGGSLRGPSSEAARRGRGFPGHEGELPGPRRFGRRHGKDLPMASGARTRAPKALSKGEEARSTRSEGKRRSAATALRTWEVRPRSPEARSRGRGSPFEELGATILVLRATPQVLVGLSHALGSAAHVVGDERSCLEVLFGDDAKCRLDPSDSPSSGPNVGAIRPNT